MPQYWVMQKSILTASILALSATALFATNIQHTGLDWTRGMTIEIQAGDRVSNASAGVGVLMVDGVSFIDAFCVNLFQGITLYQNYSATSVAPTSYDLDGEAAAWLMQTFLPKVNAAASGSSREMEGAALQLAIWDVIHDGGDGFASGRVRSTGNTNSGVLALANQWRLESLDQHGSAGIYLPAPNSRAFQPQLYLTGCAANGSCGGGGEVPEPGTLAMVAIGGLGLYFGTWRRRTMASK